MRKNLLFIINPVSGRRHSKGQLLEALNQFSKHDFRVEVYITQKAQDAYFYTLEHAKEFDLVVVSGGDGTLNEVTSALVQFDTKPILGYLPAGTMNDFASSFNLSTNLIETTQKICNMHTDEFDMGKINEQYFNYVAGFGMICEVSYETDQNLKNIIGNLAYIIKGISLLPNLKPYHVKMKIDDEFVEKDVMFGLIVNGIRVSGFELVEKNRDVLKDGIFNVILVEHTANLLELYNYPAGLLNPTMNWKYVSRYQAKHIEILSDVPMKWTLDGEEGKETKEAKIDVIPRAIQICC